MWDRLTACCKTICPLFFVGDINTTTYIHVKNMYLFAYSLTNKMSILVVISTNQIALET
jgi:phage regulator Rha-like protein